MERRTLRVSINLRELTEGSLPLRRANENFMPPCTIYIRNYVYLCLVRGTSTGA